MERLMSELPACTLCARGYTRPDGDHVVCADCGHEDPAVPGDAVAVAMVVRDVNGNPLASGDSLVVIKELKVKGSSIALLQGAVIRNIRLVDGDAEHIQGNSDKIKGLVLQVCFLKRARFAAAAGH